MSRKDRQMGQVELKQLTQRQWDRMAKQHELWVESRGKEGKQMVLHRRRLLNLKRMGGRNLKNVRITECVLTVCSLSGTSMEEGNLSNSVIHMCSLRYVNLYRADLRGTVLRDCNTTGVAIGMSCMSTGLKGDRILAGQFLFHALKMFPELYTPELKKFMEPFIERHSPGYIHLSKFTGVKGRERHLKRIIERYVGKAKISG